MMEIMTKSKFCRLVSIMLVYLIALYAAGCTKKPADEREKIILHYWDDFNPTNNPAAVGIQNLIEEYNRRNDKIRVKYQFVPGAGQMGKKFLISVAGGTSPDLYLLDRFLVAPFAHHGALTPLDSYISKSSVRGSDFFEVAWNEGFYAGSVWGIPSEVGTRLLFYRVDDFREVDLDPDKPPRTWDELEVYADKLTKYDSAGKLVRAGFVPGVGNDFIYMYTWLNGGRFMNEDKTAITCNEKKTVEAMAWMLKMRDKYGMKGINALQAAVGAEAFDLFLMGKLSMKIDGVWYIHNIKKLAPDLEYKVAMPPHPEGKQSITWSGGFAFVIPKGAKHPDEAWDFIKYMTSYESQVTYGRLSSMIPALKKAAYSGEVYNTQIKPFIDALQACKYRPVTPLSQIYFDKLNQAQEYVYLHQKTPQQALDDVVKELTPELKNILSTKK